MTADGVRNAAVQRVLARDDLLTMAKDAEAAVGIAHQRDRLVQTAADLFQVALGHHLCAAENSSSRAARSQALYHAGALIRFCQLVDEPLDTDADPVLLYQEADAQLRSTTGGERVPHDLNLDIKTRYRRIRDLRLHEDYRQAQDLAEMSDDEFFATGAEPYRAHVQYEHGVCLLRLGQARQVDGAFRESEKAYWDATRAGRFVTRHRYDFMRGIAAWELGDGPTASGRFATALGHLTRTGRRDPQYDASALSLMLAFAEQLTVLGPAGPDATRALRLARRAIDIAERVRSRWGVIARSQSPLSMAFRRVYGDIALLVSLLPGTGAAELGLRVALSAKQTGFASRMRTERALVTRSISLLIEDIMDVERPSRTPRTEAQVAGQLQTLKVELERRFSPMLADTVLPAPRDVSRLVDLVGHRYALDYVSVPDTLAKTPNWFRTLIRPGGGIEFEGFTPGPHFTAFFERDGMREPWLKRLRRTDLKRGPDWRGLARELLPASLLADLAARTRDDPVELLISTHAAVSLLPWAALQIDDAGTRLVEHAIIDQTPVLTCLSEEPVPCVADPALVRLVASRDVDVEPERAQWRLPVDADLRVPLSSCRFDADTQPTTVAGELLAALQDSPDFWRVVHIASHGSGEGLGQRLDLPEALTAGQALAARWPESVLMASCRVGQLVNLAHAEPFSFVTALLTRGSRCVVAAIGDVPDFWAGPTAAAIVEQVRSAPIRLDVALRNAQLRLLHEPVAAWALFTAYAR